MPVEPVEEPVAASPWPAHLPVVHTGSPEFAALFQRARKAT